MIADAAGRAIASALAPRQARELPPAPGFWRACPPWVHNNRNRVERLWAGLKEWRAMASRCEKTAASFTVVLCFAASMDWLKSQQVLLVRGPAF